MLPVFLGICGTLFFFGENVIFFGDKSISFSIMDAKWGDKRDPRLWIFVLFECVGWDGKNKVDAFITE